MSRKTVLITGCSTGIGRLSAKTFHANNWNVISTMRSPEKETELTRLDGVLVVKLDVNDPATIDMAIAEGIARFGQIDGLVNNAGRGGRALLEQITDEKILEMFQTNVFGVMRVTRAVLPHMRQRGSGFIINVSSVAGMLGLPVETTYCSSKYALEGFTEALAWECKPLGICVKSVAPGVYRTTSFLANIDDAALASGAPELVAHAQKLRNHFSQATDRVRGEQAPADAQEVADQIFLCATSDTPVHNPVGRDAQMLLSMIGSPPRQAFLDKVEPLLLPPEVPSH
jgi:NAD(P)-dependent dehydrogenase (short-subunit alcohol dehydrogenase family)